MGILLFIWIALASLMLIAFCIYFTIGFIRGWLAFDQDDLINRFGLAVVFGIIWYPAEHDYF